MKVHPLLVGLDDVAPVEEVVVVYHAAGKVGLAQHLIYELAGFLKHSRDGFLPTCFIR